MVSHSLNHILSYTYIGNRDEDLLKYKEQEVRMDALISALRQASLVEESSVREADELKAQLRYV